MTMIFLLLPISLAIVVLAVAAYVWAVRRGQFDDLETPPMRMLFDDEDDGSPQR